MTAWLRYVKPSLQKQIQSAAADAGTYGLRSKLATGGKVNRATAPQATPKTKTTQLPTYERGGTGGFSPPTSYTNVTGGVPQQPRMYAPVTGGIPQATTNKSGNDFGWTFDAPYEQAINSILSRRAGLESERELQRRRITEDFERLLADLGEQHGDALEQNTVNMADQGILRSGINIAQQGELGSEYQDLVGRAGQGRANALEDLQRWFAAGQQALQQEQSQVEIERARREEQRRAEEARRQAEAEAAQRAAEAQQKFIEDTLRRIQPQPTPTGSYIPGTPGGATPAPTPGPSNGPSKIPGTLYTDGNRVALKDAQGNWHYSTGPGQLAAATALYGQPVRVPAEHIGPKDGTLEELYETAFGVNHAIDLAAQNIPRAPNTTIPGPQHTPREIPLLEHLRSGNWRG